MTDIKPRFDGHFYTWHPLASEAIRKLRDIQEGGDPEAAHAIADDILCTTLIGLGFGDVVDEWRKVEKWYA